VREGRLVILAVMLGGASLVFAQEVKVHVHSTPTTSESAEVRADLGTALALLRSGNLEEGRKHLLALVSSGTADAKVFYNLAIAEMRSGLLEDARRHAMKAVEMSRGSWKALKLVVDLARRSGALEETRSWLDRLSDQLGDSIAVANASARLRLYEGKPMQAIRDASAILKKDETNSEALKTLVLAYLAMNRLEAVALMIGEMLKSMEGDGELFDMAATLALKTGDKIAAMAHLEKAVAYAPSLVDAHVRLGYLYFDAGNYEKAISEFQAALVWDTVNLAALLGIGNAYRRMQNYEKAIATFSRAIELYPDCADCYYSMGVAYLEYRPPEKDEPGHYKKALEYFEKYRATYRGGVRRDDPVDKYVDEARRMLDYLERQRIRQQGSTSVEQTPLAEPHNVQLDTEPQSSPEGEYEGEGLKLK